jgi:hypothetical protein
MGFHDFFAGQLLGADTTSELNGGHKADFGMRHGIPFLSQIEIVTIVTIST